MSKEGLSCKNVPDVIDRLKPKYICANPTEKCIRSSMYRICCCECDKPCKQCQNTPRKCGAKLKVELYSSNAKHNKNIKNCIFCGKKFKARYKSKKFCSQECKVLWQCRPLRVTSASGEVMYFKSSVEAAEKLHYSDSCIRNWVWETAKSREGYTVDYISFDEYEKVVSK